MLYVVTNTPNQSAYLTLKEGALLLGTTFTHYLLELKSELGNNVYRLVPTVMGESDRITHLVIGTDLNDPTAGSVLITSAGRYSYKVYGQNSATNIDPLDASVVGMVEQGLAELTNSNNLYSQPTTAISPDIVYNG